jgi:penicillin-binding protein 1C
MTCKGLWAFLVLMVPTGVAFWWMPLPEGLKSGGREPLILVDRNGEPLREVLQDGSAYPEWIPLAEIPRKVIDATLAAEDKRFYRHAGIDPIAMARAAWQWTVSGQPRSGASTLTQQLVKMAAPGPRTLKRKAWEALAALRLECTWSKEEILEAYLNRLDYGHLRIGIASAARFYFGKSPGDLSTPEAAFLAGIPNAPSRFNPHKRRDLVEERKSWVLWRMKEAGWLDEEAYARAVRGDVLLEPPAVVFQAPHFIDLLSRKAPGLLRLGGTVRTTLDLALNRHAESRLRTHLARLRENNARHGAVVVVDNRNSEVLALVGSESYFSADGGQVNGAWAPRSTGSALKPFTYTLALERGWTPATILEDVPCEFVSATGIFRPVNYNGTCSGPVSLRGALANSLNIPAVRLLDQLGGAGELVRVLQECGVGTFDKAPEHYGLGLTIGNGEARLLELVSAYACLARLGEARPWRMAEAAVRPGDQERPVRRVFSREAAYLTADILSDNHARRLTFGSSSALAFDFPVACKTGTSSDYRDNWAFGYTPEFTVGVWVGNFDGSPMRGVSGVSGAAPVLRDVMIWLHERRGTSWYERPPRVVECEIDAWTGKLPVAATVSRVMERFGPAELPPAGSKSDYDTRGRLLLGEAYRGWLESGENWLGNRAVAEQVPRGNKARIVSPAGGTVFFWDPDLSAEQQVVAVKVSGFSQPEIVCGTLRKAGDKAFYLKPGRHRIEAREAGKSDSVWISVKAP